MCFTLACCCWNCWLLGLGLRRRRLLLQDDFLLFFWLFILLIDVRHSEDDHVAVILPHKQELGVGTQLDVHRVLSDSFRLALRLVRLRHKECVLEEELIFAESVPIKVDYWVQVCDHCDADFILKTPPNPILLDVLLFILCQIPPCHRHLYDPLPRPHLLLCHTHLLVQVQNHYVPISIASYDMIVRLRSTQTILLPSSHRHRNIE